MAITITKTYFARKTLGVCFVRDGKRCAQLVGGTDARAELGRRFPGELELAGTIRKSRSGEYVVLGEGLYAGAIVKADGRLVRLTERGSVSGWRYVSTDAATVTTTATKTTSKHLGRCYCGREGHVMAADVHGIMRPMCRYHASMPQEQRDDFDAA